MEYVRPVVSGFFPLDEELDLEEGWLSPRSQEQLVHLAIWMPFERATQMLAELTGVQASEATARRRSYRVGKAALEVETARASGPSPEVPEEIRKTKHIISPDGAMVPLVHGQWAEVKTVAVARVDEGKEGKEVHSTHLSYFSRMLDAASFTEQASAELIRRGIDQIELVCAAMDGAEWIDGFLDWLCPLALRILDFPHAAEYVNEIGKLAQAAGSELPEGWLKAQLHTLKHDGPVAVLGELRRLRDGHPLIEEMSKKLTYLEKREARMQYQEYRAQGWPIGSGIVESGNKVVMQARLKGPGMHWAPPHVNPMLALRCGACSDRWDETYEQAHIHHQKQRVIKRNERRDRRYQQNLQVLNIFLLMCKWRSSRPEPIAVVAIPPFEKHVDTLVSPDVHSSSISIPHLEQPSDTLILPGVHNTTIAIPSLENISATPSLSAIHNTTVTISPPEKHSNPLRPSATHPWRQRLLAKK
jgi:hypothetical protein